MTPEVLWCNLDPAWPFADLVQCHCLDLLPGEHTWVWDASGGAGVPGGAWPDWPRPVAPGRLPDTLDDLPSPAPLSPPLLVLMHLPLPQSEQSPAGRLAELVADSARRLARRHAELVLVLPPEVDDAATAPWWPKALMVVRLTDGDAVRRIHAQRLLVEWLQDPVLGAELRDLTGPEVLDLGLTTERNHVGSDRVAQDWSAAIPGILREIDILQRGVGEGTGADSEPSQRFERVFRSLKDLLPGTGSGPPQPQMPPQGMAALRLRAPLFRRGDLARRLGERGSALLAHLNDHLQRRYAELAAAHQGLADAQRKREAELLEVLSSLGPATVGLGDAGQLWLDRQEVRCRGLEAKTTEEAERLMGELERDLRPAEPEAFGDYLRHRFAEDESFDAAVTAAQTEASRLVRLSSLATAWGTATLVASVPVLAARMPGWLGLGLSDYLGDLSRWAPDLVWLVLPGAFLILGALAIATQRRRRLASAWAAVEQSADVLWQRHERVLDATFQYAGLVLAMRQLSLVRDHLRRLRQDARVGRQGLRDLQFVLERQAEHYRSCALAALGGVASPPLGPSLGPAVAAGGGPRQWAEAMVRALPTPSREPIEVWHKNLSMGAKLHSPYLRGYAAAELAPPGETGCL